MKNSILLVSVFLFLCSAGKAQQIKRCSSAEYEKTLQDQDPAYAQLRRNIEIATAAWISSHQGQSQRSVITIPIVFHLLYNDSSQYLDDAVVLSQLDAINEDYRRLNADAGQTPLAFRAVAADCEIEFCLAKRTPSGGWTNGIVHKFTTVTAFSDLNDVKFNVTGGDDVWDATQYLNIWVAAFTNPNFLGIGTFPGGNMFYDGVVINYKACGRIGTHLMTHYNKGRSLTHEIGHWLNLIHPWADDGGDCSSDDSITDTPMQGSETYGCPNYPKTDNCSTAFPGIMFMNFMDYTDDACMNIFTSGQKARMLAALNLQRTSILSSNGCVSVGIEEDELKNFISVYPNPAHDKIVIQNTISDQTRAEIFITNITGQRVALIQPAKSILNLTTAADISLLHPGIYFLHVQADKGATVFKIVKQ